MGLNYYLEIDQCPTCGKPRETLHIGKSSAGWVFMLRFYPDRDIWTLYDWLPYLIDNIIKNDYDEVVSTKELLGQITCRLAGLKRGYGKGVVKGEGTWDYIEYDFS